MKKILYIFYFFKKTPKKQFKKFLDYAVLKSNKSRKAILFDIIKSSYKYNISFLDYYYFRFFEKNNEEKEQWAGTGFMYEYQLKMNPKEHRDVLENKIKFLREYKDFVIRKSVNIYEASKSDIQGILNNTFGKVVAKGSMGQVGAEVKVLDSNSFDADTIIDFMKSHKLDLLEECVEQHADLMVLSPSGLNTIRVFTQLDDQNNVIFLGARLRVTVNSPIDNMAAGNFACVIDMNTGIVISDGVFSDITKEDLTFHPITKVQIKGFKVPKWAEVMDLTRQATLLNTNNRSIGWDVAIRNDGVELIEGNHNWCKLLYQLPVKKGLKNELVKYFN